MQEVGPDLGLHLNLSKCLLYWPDEDPEWTSFPPEIQKSTEGTLLLGAPIGTEEFMRHTAIVQREQWALPISVAGFGIPIAQQQAQLNFYCSVHRSRNILAVRLYIPKINLVSLRLLKSRQTSLTF
jgi:hypothetical protein